MKKNIQKFHIANSILWAAAIIAGAIMQAPTTFTLILLPALSAFSFLATEQLLNRGE